MPKPKILVVDDELSMREFLEILLKKEGYRVVTAGNGEEAIRLFKKDHYDLVITDIKMPKGDGLALLHGIKKQARHIPVIMITAYASPDDAIVAMKEGAYDYIAKPFKVEEVKSVIRGALEAGKVEDVVSEEVARDRFGDLVGKTPEMQRIYETIKRVASTTTNVLISGESGTGKELVARAIQKNSPRKDKPFVTINCSAIPETLLESELFGHVKGAFTGALTSKIGLFEMAKGGTVFLDEIGDLTPMIQIKLLRVVEEKEFKRVGGTEDIKVDVRIISATNKDLEQEVIAGRFREDLFYRLNVIHIDLPPLRERREDIPLLVRHFLKKYPRELGKDIREISSYALKILMDYEFPGNVRELENIIERSVALETTKIILPESMTISFHKKEKKAAPTPVFPADLSLGEIDPKKGINLEKAMDRFEKNLILRVLDVTRGSKLEAAKLLKVSFRSLRYRLDKYGIT